MNQEEQLSANDLTLLQLGRRLQADGYRFITPTPAPQPMSTAR